MNGVAKDSSLGAGQVIAISLQPSQKLEECVLQIGSHHLFLKS